MTDGPKVSRESGMPSTQDYYTTGSEYTFHSFIVTPQGMTRTAPSALKNKHQNNDDTRLIGMPGTDYTPHRTDKIIRSEGGHALIMGNAPGDEAMRMQPRQGGVIEIGKSGVKITSESGMHFSISGEFHIILSGDLEISTTGDINMKCGNFNLDCHDFNVNASGNKMTNVQGTENKSVDGDSHKKVLGDSSHTVGGDHAQTVAGNHSHNVAGDHSSQTLGKSDVRSKGDMSHGSQGNYSRTIKGNVTNNANGNYSSASSGDMSQTAKGKMSKASDGDMSFSTQGNKSLNAKGATTMSSGGKMDVGSRSGDAQFTGATSTRVAASSGPVSLTSPGGVAAQGTMGSANAFSIPTKNDPANNTFDEAKVKVDAPTNKQILDSIGDYVATKGEIDQIYSSQQLDDMYEVAEGGKIPDDVMKRAKEKGVINETYQAASAENYSGDSDSSAGFGSTGSFGVV